MHSSNVHLLFVNAQFVIFKLLVTLVDKSTSKNCRQVPVCVFLLENLFILSFCHLPVHFICLVLMILEFEPTTNVYGLDHQSSTFTTRPGTSPNFKRFIIQVTKKVKKLTLQDCFSEVMKFTKEITKRQFLKFQRCFHFLRFS